MKISKAVGIDLGTTRSLVGIMDAQDKQVFLWRDEFNKATVPSVVQWDAQNGRFKVGEEAMLTRHQEPYPIRSIKRQMGFNIEIPHADKKMRPEEVSAEILKFLKCCGEQLVVDKFGKDKNGAPLYVIDRAIVTIPAYFDQPRIEATRKAAELAGLITLELLHEPTAAALYYCWKHNIQNGNFLVYDLGGGTFDVSILRRVKGSFEVLGISGDIVLGGDTFDMALAEHICSFLHADGKGRYNMKLDVQNDPKDKARFDYFVWKAEGIKTRLSLEDQVLFSDTSCPLPDKNGNSLHVEMRITRPEFEKLIAQHINRTIDEICRVALDKAEEKAKGTFKGIEDIDYILLVGGSTWIPYVKKTVREKMCAQKDASGKPLPKRARCVDVLQDEPDECVAYGAALQAAASGGVIFRDEEKKVSVHIRGASIVADEEYKIKGSVFRNNPEEENKDSPFKGFTMTMLQDGDSMGDVEIGSDGSFSFEEIFLERDKASKVTLSLQDPSGSKISEFSRVVGRGEGLSGTNDPVNAQPIWMWAIDKKGNKDKDILIGAGVSLPCEITLQPHTTNDPRFVKFILHQGNMEIKQVSHEFEREIPVGTKLNISISMDKQGNMVLRSHVEGLEPFVMELTPPPPPPPPTKKDLDAIVTEYAKQKENLPPAKRAVTDIKFKQVSKDLENALAHGDAAAAFERVAELRQMIDTISAAEKVLVPSRDDFDRLVKEAQETIRDARDTLGKKADELLKNIEAQVQMAGQAYQEKNQQSLSECCEAIRSYKSFAEKQAASKLSQEDLPPLRILIPAFAQKCISELQELHQRSSDPAFKKEAQKHIEALETVPMFIATDEEARQYVPKLQAAIKMIDNIKRSLGMPVSKDHDGIPNM